MSKPAWLKVKAPGLEFFKTHEIVRQHNLKTVCEEAACPNMGECWPQGHATFMILGSICTRACKFCNVATGIPDKLDPHEPDNIASAAKSLSLKHIVITSVDRDDLADGGASHFANCIEAIRKTSPDTTIEVLTPDFLRKGESYLIVVQAKPDVYNHNVETVPSLYNAIRPGARYFNSLNLLWKVKQANKDIFTKSGIMLGLGEKEEEVLQVMDDLRSAGVDFLTIGQYLQPTQQHAPVDRYVEPKEFEYYGTVASNRGFVVESGPLVRSSYKAGEGLARLKKLKNNEVS